MDFVTHLPRTQQKHDAVWVIVDQLTKSVHFLAVWMTFALERFCQLYIREIVRLHGVPVSNVQILPAAQHVRFPRGVSRLHAPEIYSRSSSCGGLGAD